MGFDWRGGVFLAPMAGVTDMPYRVICAEMGAGLTVTEMVSAKGLVYGNAATKRLLAFSPDERPVAAQLFGREPDVIAEAVRRVQDMGFGLIDINMGCPAPKITRNGEGSALMAEPGLVGRIVRAVSGAARLPVTIKIRKGCAGSDNAAEIARIAEDNGAAAVTVHGRTREQGYSGKADWGVVAAVKRAVSIPVAGNGDVASPEDAARMLARTGADAVMIGRAAHGDPWIFRRVSEYLKTGRLPPPPDAAERLDVFSRHLRGLTEFYGEYTAVRRMRGHFCQYARGIPGVSAIRVRAARAERPEELIALAREAFSPLFDN
ncbi:MAG: tRNA dihydrouridine synthase DusB [Clostridiales bacterium]|jgi:nifR3 family TIM-barrel protein|nr:tRNA dihydrouridine synthase DusB [Clostridiales bacterium]